jgi:hypothetical protein
LFLDCCGAPATFLSHCETEIEAVTGGAVDQASVRLDRTTLEIAAVLDAEGERHALLTIVRPPGEVPGDSASALLNDAIDTSPAIVWLKDMNRRYLRVNDKYAAELATTAEQVCGKADDELAPGQSIEGLRLRDGHDPKREPLEFEYTVDTGGDRPPFAVLRFALRDNEAKPTAVCGIAAPLPRAHLARSECARLMRLVGWVASDEKQICAELIAEWGLIPADESAVALAPPPAKPESKTGDAGDADQFAAMAAELDAALETSARLDQELAEERRQVMVLRESSVLSARRAQDMFRTVTAERARSATLEESLANAEAKTAELEQARSALEQEIERLRAVASAALTPEQLEAERAEAHEAKLAAEEAQAEVASVTAALAKERRAVEGLRAELRAAEEEVGRARRAATEAVAQAPTHDELEQERRRADRATASLASARAHAELSEAEAKSALAQARAELRRTHEEAAATADALHAEKQSAVSLRAEVAEARAELERVRGALSERPDAEQLEQERARAAQAEALAEEARRESSELADRVAELEQAAVEAAESSGALSAEQRTVKKLREELSTLRTELTAAKRAAAERLAPEELENERARAERAESAAEEARQDASDLADRVAELEQAAIEAAESSGALSAEQRTVKKLREELSTLRAELKAAKRAVANRPAEEAVAAAEDAERRASAATSAAEADRVTIEALRTELSAAHAELAQWQSQAADDPVVSMPTVEPSTPAKEPAPGGPSWSLRAQHAFSSGLVAISDWRAALKQAVKVVGVEGGWDAVVVWSPEPRRKDMKCGAMWSNEPLSETTFETRVWQHRHKLSADTGSAESHVTAPLDGAADGLLKAASDAGMNSSVLVPIGDGTQLLGMLQLFSSHPEPPTSELIVSLEAIGLQLAGAGRLLESAGTPHWRVGRL